MKKIKNWVRYFSLFIVIIVIFPISYKFAKTTTGLDQIFRFILLFGLQLKILDKIAF